MPTSSFMDVEAAPPVTNYWLPPELRGPKLKAQAGSLVHTYTTDASVMSRADWVYLEVSYKAYQIHPATVEQLTALGPVGGRSAKRWTIEGPTSARSGDPGVGSNCTVVLEIAHSFTTTPGSDWKLYSPTSRYKLRSMRARLTITRPDSTYNFRVTSFKVRAKRASPQNRPRVVSSGVTDVVPNSMSRVVVHDFEVQAGATFEVEAGAFMEVLT